VAPQARAGEVVISQAVYRLVQPEVRITREFEVRLKGIQGLVTLYTAKDLAAT
jgi:class 3 adenylate cyclase